MASQNRFSRIVIFIVLSGFLYSLETFIPRPAPFIRLGLGNVLVLFSIITMGIPAGFQVGIGKSIAGALITGSFLSPSFLLSVCGTTVSVIVMSFLYRLRIFGIIGISVGGAMANGITQALIVSGMFAGTGSFLYIGTIMSISGLITGTITGIITVYLLRFNERRSCGFEN